MGHSLNVPIVRTIISDKNGRIKLWITKRTFKFQLNYSLFFYLIREEINVIEAASVGASAAILLVLNIATNLIAFIALLALFNGILGYLGALVGYPEFSFEVTYL